MTSPDFDYQFHQFLSQRQLFKKPVILTYEDRDMYDFQEEDQEYETYDQQSDTSSVLGDDNNLISNDSKEFEHSSTTMKVTVMMRVIWI